MMRNFTRRDSLLPNVLILASLLIMAGALIFMFLVPVPDPVDAARQQELNRQRVESEVATAIQQASLSGEGARMRLWYGDSETVTAAVLEQVTEQANRRGLRLTAFRPQRLQTLPGIAELPFTVQVSGLYPSVSAAVAALETPGSRVSVRSVQIASSDAASSAVTATIAISAFLASDVSTQVLVKEVARD